MNTETVAAIVGTTGDIFRLLNRVLTQMERIAKINGLDRLGRNCCWQHAAGSMPINCQKSMPKRLRKYHYKGQQTRTRCRNLSV